MQFLNYGFLGYKYSLDATSTNVSPINEIELKNGIYDHLYVTKSINETASPISSDWDYNTILIADFENDLQAGNVGYSAEQVSFMVVKRRKVGEFDWITLYAKAITSVDDFNFIFVDKTARSKQEYEYAIVPQMSTGELGEYNTNTIKSEFDGLFIINESQTFNTVLDVEISNIKRNKSTSVIAPPMRKYPYVISNGTSNYVSGTCIGTFIEFIESSCSWDVENGYRYRQDLMDFLTDGTQKILKYHDGRMWLVNIVSEPQEETNGHEDRVKTSFEFVEIGNPESNDGLYNANIINYSES